MRSNMNPSRRGQSVKVKRGAGTGLTEANKVRPMAALR